MAPASARLVPLLQMVQAAMAGLLAALLAPRAYAVLGRPDFLAFWAAHHVAAPYDARLLSEAAGVGQYFPYPPTFLLLTWPLRGLTAYEGYAGWIVLSAAALVLALRRPAALAILLAPAVFVAGVIGQTSLLVGALLFAGATVLHRPLLAGLFLGLAACVKPQVGVLIPVVLLAAREWRVIVAAVVVVVALAVAATLAYHPAVWTAWISAMPAFLQANDDHLKDHYISLPGAWRLAALAVGAVAAWRTARAGRPGLAMFIAIAAALLGSMHAMNYDQAILAPFAFAAGLERRWRGLPYFALLACPIGLPATLALGAAACADAWTALSPSPGEPTADLSGRRAA